MPCCTLEPHSAIPSAFGGNDVLSKILADNGVPVNVVDVTYLLTCCSVDDDPLLDEVSIKLPQGSIAWSADDLPFEEVSRKSFIKLLKGINVKWCSSAKTGAV